MDSIPPPNNLDWSPPSAGETDPKEPLPVKTEAANPYLQYVMARRKALLSVNPKGVLDMKTVNEDWKKVKRSDDEIGIYQELAKMEKEQLGASWGLKRKNRKRKLDNTTRKQEKGKKLVTKGQEDRENDSIVGDASASSKEIDEEKHTVESLLMKLESLDDEIDIINAENDRVKIEISSASNELAVRKYILESKSDSCDSYQSKYSDLLEKHSSCFKKADGDSQSLHVPSISFRGKGPGH